MNKFWLLTFIHWSLSRIKIWIACYFYLFPNFFQVNYLEIKNTTNRHYILFTLVRSVSLSFDSCAMYLHIRWDKLIQSINRQVYFKVHFKSKLIINNLTLLTYFFSWRHLSATIYYFWRVTWSSKKKSKYVNILHILNAIKKPSKWYTA